MGLQSLLKVKRLVKFFLREGWSGALFLSRFFAG